LTAHNSVIEPKKQQRKTLDIRTLLPRTVIVLISIALVVNPLTGQFSWLLLAHKDATPQSMAKLPGLLSETRLLPTQQLTPSYSSIPSPISGNLKILAIPVRFADVSNATNIETDIVQRKIAPLTTYYSQISYGSVFLDVECLPFWSTLPKSMQYYGENSGIFVDANFMDFVRDSLDSVDSVVDFRNYGYVMFVHVGNDEASSREPLDIWSQAAIGKEYFANDGGVMLGFAAVAETDPYGVFAHEFGHSIGLPDLYDYSGKQDFVFKWSLMDQGSWLNPPVSLMAAEKMWLGWISSNNLTIVDPTTISNITLSTIEEPGQILAVKIPLAYGYYTVEYRTRTLTDQMIPMNGVIIAYVNESASSGDGPIAVKDATLNTVTLNDGAFVAGTRFVDSANEVAVKILSVDSSAVQIRAQEGFAELVIEDVQILGEPLQGRDLHFEVKVKNIGITPSEPCVASLKINEVGLQSKILEAIDPNASIVLDFGLWSAQAGRNDAEAVIDVNDDVVERDENNNVALMTLDVTEHSVSIDRTIVSNQRADLNSTQKVFFHTKWKDNSSDVEGGTIYVNDTAYVTNSTGWIELTACWNYVETVSWQVTGVYVDGVLDYEQEVPNPWIVWDAFEVYDRGASKYRCDVGSTQTIWTKIRYASDGRMFDNSTGAVSIGGRAAEWIAQNECWTIRDSRDIAVQIEYEVPSDIEDTLFGLTSLVAVRQITIIWDRANVSISPRSNRIDVGAFAVFDIKGSYEYDATPWNGTAVLNDTLFKVTVGEFSYSVTSITDPVFGLSDFESNIAVIIFDRVLLNLSLKDERINVGDAAQIIVTGTHESDGRPWDGSFTLDGSLVEDQVGIHHFQVTSITDVEFNLTAFQSNIVSVVWDRVNLQLACPYQKVQVGTPAPISWTGKYDFDDTAFVGEVVLDDDVIKNSTQPATYTVANLSDSLYNLTVFSSNSVHLIFDNIVYKLEATALYPGTVEAKVNLTFQSDNSPVTNANVTINGQKANSVAAGVYSTTIPEWRPYAIYHLAVEKENFILDSQVSFFAAGNIILLSIVAAMIAVAAMLLFMRRKNVEQPTPYI
jgi:M6 family metalloprotease-like protein